MNFSKMRTTPKIIKNITDAPNGDVKFSAGDYSADTPNTADYDAGSTDYKKSLYS